MRIVAVIVVAIFSIVAVGCSGPDGVRLQPPVQGAWSNFHNDKDKVTKDPDEDAVKPSAEK